MESTYKNITDFEGKVKTIIAYKLKVDEKEITPEASFIDNFDADILDMVDLVMEFEDKFDISIPADQIEKIYTVNDAFESVKNNGRRIMLNNIDSLPSTLNL